MAMGIGIGIGIGLSSSGPAVPSTCPVAQSLTSGVAKAVNGSGTTERWYKFTVTQTGTLTIAITNSTGA